MAEALPENEIKNYQDETVKESENKAKVASDPLLLYLLYLHKYISIMDQKLRIAVWAHQFYLPPPRGRALPIPKMPQLIKQTSENILKPKVSSPLDMLNVDDEVMNQTFRGCISTMLDQLGFETTHPSVLNMITNMSVEFLKTVINTLKLAQDGKTGLNSLADICKKTSDALSSEGATGFNVVEYVADIQNRCREIKQYYENLISHSSSSESGVDSAQEDDYDIMKMVEDPIPLAILKRFFKGSCRVRNSARQVETDSSTSSDCNTRQHDDLRDSDSDATDDSSDADADTTDDSGESDSDTTNDSSETDSDTTAHSPGFDTDTTGNSGDADTDTTDNSGYADTDIDDSGDTDSDTANDLSNFDTCTISLSSIKRSIENRKKFFC